MNVSHVLLILLARRRMVVATLLATVALTVLVSVLLPKTYTATASVLLNYKGVDPLTGLTLPGQLLPGYMPTQVDIIGSKKVALRVVDQLRLAQQPASIAQYNDATEGRGTLRNWLADGLLKKLTIAPSRESSVIEIVFQSADPEFAAAVANAFADAYQKVSIALKVEPMKNAALYFDAQTRHLRAEVETAQNKLSQYQQENGIVSLDNRLDVEGGRLSDLSAQLVAAQGQALEATSRQKMAQGGRAAESPDVAASPMILNLKMSVGAAELKLTEIAQRLAPNHPAYVSARAELDKLRAELGAQSTAAANRIGANAQILQQRQGALQAAVDAQKARLLVLNRTRDQLGILLKEVEMARHAFDVTSQRFSQTRLEGQAEQSDISVLNPAVAPLTPARPRLLLNILAACLVGSVLGVVLSLLAELVNRRVRAPRDLFDGLRIPVLGVIEWNTPPRRRFAALPTRRIS